MDDDKKWSQPNGGDEGNGTLLIVIDDDSCSVSHPKVNPIAKSVPKNLENGVGLHCKD